MANRTIRVLGGCDFELRCMNKCGDDDVSVDPDTGICSVCGEVYDIEETEVRMQNIKIRNDDGTMKRYEELFDENGDLLE